MKKYPHIKKLYENILKADFSSKSVPATYKVIVMYMIHLCDIGYNPEEYTTDQIAEATGTCPKTVYNAKQYVHNCKKEIETITINAIRRNWKRIKIL